MHICPASALPSIDGLMASFAPALTFPPSLPQVPQILPSLPSPIYANIHVPNLEIVTTAIELQAFQFQNTMMGMIQPMLSLLGRSLSSFLPSIPGLPGMTLVDLLAGNPAALVAAMKASILGGFTLPGIPSPLYPTLNIPDISTIHTLQMVVSNYMQIVTTAITGLIGNVTSKLKIPNISGLPTFPSLASVLDTVMAAVAAGGASLSHILAGLSFPGFPALPLLPDPLIPSFSMPDIELVQGITTLYNNLSLGMLTPIMTFITNTLSRFLSFTFPIMCIDL